MRNTDFNKSLKEAGSKEIILGLIKVGGLVFALFLFDKLILEDLPSEISFFLPIVAVILLFVMRKKEREAIENITNKFKKTTSSKIIVLTILVFLAI